MVQQTRLISTGFKSIVSVAFQFKMILV